ncbi:hypothetical protein [Streptomyces sp. enrichment culture]|uniref:hypothetical protein n=1 Tax=Streptomyces sp. enrichment culture TaxID=1795815 RepID=UPI003F54FE98
MTVIGLHGIGQERVGARQLAREWSAGLTAGARRAGIPQARLPDPLFDIAYYAHLYRPGAATLGREAGPEDEIGLEEAEFLQAVLAELDPVAAAAHTPPPDVLNRFVGVFACPAWLTRTMLWLDERRGRRISETLVRRLRQVWRYLTEPALADGVRELLGDRLRAAPEPVVLAAHSLGSVVAADLVAGGAFPPGGSRLVTFGSPLAYRVVRERMLDGRSFPAAPPCDWTNVHDPQDVVTASRGLAGLVPGVTDIRVGNWAGNAHAAANYLRRPQTARALLVPREPA